jgi:PAS domain S-box-containing protein
VALAAMAMLVLLGWGLKVEWLKSAVPGLPPIEVNVAVCFLLAGLSLWLLQPEAVPAATAGGLANKLPWRRQGGLALAWLVTLLAALTLSQYLFRWELGIDQLLFENVSAPPDTRWPGRMGPNAAVGFLILGLALLLLEVDVAPQRHPAEALALLAVVWSILPMVGHLYALTGFYQLPDYPAMGVQTCVGHLVVGLAILCARPERGVMRLFASHSSTGIVARRLVVAALLLPLAMASAATLGRGPEASGPAFLPAFQTLLLTATFVALALSSARLFQQAETRRQRAEAEVSQYGERLEGLVAERTRALQQSEARLRNLLESATDGIVVAGLDRCIQLFSQGAERMFGYSASEIVGKDTSVLVAPEHKASHGAGFARYLETGQAQVIGRTVELKARRRTGEVFPIELSLSESRAWGEVSFIAVIRDLTERKEAQARLQAAQAKYQSIFENAVEGIFQSTPEGRVIAVNPALARMLGYSCPEELLGAISEVERSYVDPARRAEYQRLMAEHGSVTGFEFQVYRKDGVAIWVSESARAVRDAQGTVLYYEGIMEDITAAKHAQAEREGLIAELRKALAEVKTLSGLLPICASCKKIRDDRGYWNSVEGYIQARSQATFTHGLCPDCIKKYLPDMESPTTFEPEEPLG